MRTTITKVLVLITGGAIINYVNKLINQLCVMTLSTALLLGDARVIKTSSYPLCIFSLGCVANV